MLNKDPKVSVIIPTHNHAHFLPECLASVKGQTYKNYEIIVINNGSTDNTEQVVRNFACDQLRYFYQEDTGSVAGPRNTGIKLARGEYVAFLDSDDLWYPHKLAKIMLILKNNPWIDIIAHDILLVRIGGRKMVLKSGPLHDDMFKYLLYKNRMIGSATTVKKSILNEIGGFDINKRFVHVEDYEAWLRIAFANKKFYFMNDVLGEYRLHNTNLSLLYYEIALFNEKNVIDKHISFFCVSNSFYKSILYRHRISVIYLKLSAQYFFRRKYLRAFLFLSKSFSLHPIAVVRSIFRLLAVKIID